MKIFVVLVSLFFLISGVFSQTCKCGIEKATGRIVGGHVVTSISSMPWITMIHRGSGGSHFCGGAVISSRAILTAAHCMSGESVSKVKVTIGVTKKSEVTKANSIGLQKIIVHPQYDSKKVINDIAILILDKDIDLNSYPPICIPSQKQSYGTLCVAGWGDMKDGSNKGSPDLREVCFGENDFNTCNRRWSNSLNANTQLTAGENGKDSCQGDSGGPLYTKINGRSTQAGVVSYGAKCGSICGVYTRVSGYYSWIQSTVTQNGGGRQCQ